LQAALAAEAGGEGDVTVSTEAWQMLVPQPRKAKAKPDGAEQSAAASGATDGPAAGSGNGSIKGKAAGGWASGAPAGAEEEARRRLAGATGSCLAGFAFAAGQRVTTHFAAFETHEDDGVYSGTVLCNNGDGTLHVRCVTRGSA
jgi:hypothetical protein